MYANIRLYILLCSLLTIIKKKLARPLVRATEQTTTNSNESVYLSKSHWFLTNESTEVVRWYYERTMSFVAVFFSSIVCCVLCFVVGFIHSVCLEYFILISSFLFCLRLIETRLSLKLTARPTTLTTAHMKKKTTKQYLKKNYNDNNFVLIVIS